MGTPRPRLLVLNGLKRQSDFTGGLVRRVSGSEEKKRRHYGPQADRKKAIVTTASEGIGKAITSAFAREGVDAGHPRAAPGAAEDYGGSAQVLMDRLRDR